MLNFAIGLHAALGIEVPKSDYPKLATLTGAVDYVLAAAGMSGATAL